MTARRTAHRTRSRAAALLLAAAFCGLPWMALAQGGNQVVAIVNDKVVTSFDIEQRMRLLEFLAKDPIQGDPAEQRRKAFKDLIDDELKRQEAKRLNVSVTEQQVDSHLQRMAKNSNTTVEGLREKLQTKSLSLITVRRYVESSIAFNRILSSKYKLKEEVDPGEIERRLQALNSDPRRQPKTVYELQEIGLPVEPGGGAMAGQLAYARAVEAQQILQRYKGCDSARAAAQGVFNVKIGEPMPAQPEKLPPALRQALDKLGPGRAVGPVRSPKGIVIIGFCGRKTIAPPEVTKDQVQNAILNERYGLFAERYLRELRTAALIEYKDASLKQ